MMKKIIIIFLILLPALLKAQEKTTGLKWYAVASAGVLVGEAGNYPALQLSGGLRFNRLFTGAGIGYETYQFKSFPLVADLRYHIGSKQRVFIYGMPGYNLPGKLRHEEEWNKVSDRLKGGFYLDAGFGFSLPAGKKSRFLISAGYSGKYMRREKDFSGTCQTGNCPLNTYKYNYKFGRLTTKLSWGFGS